MACKCVIIHSDPLYTVRCQYGYGNKCKPKRIKQKIHVQNLNLIIRLRGDLYSI